MDPISAAIKAFDLGYIMMAGAAVVTLVIVFVGIEKVKGLLGLEAGGALEKDFDTALPASERVDEYLTEPNEPESLTIDYGDDDDFYDSNNGDASADDEKYEYYIMSEVAEQDTFSENDWERYRELKEQYEGSFSDEDRERYADRLIEESGGPDIDEDEEMYEYFIMDAAESNTFSGADWERYRELKERYGDYITDEDKERYADRLIEEGGGFDDDDDY